MARAKFESIDEYIDEAPKEVRAFLKSIRKEVQRRVPDAEETISYGMPAFRGKRVFFFFAAFKKHIGVYPPLKDRAFKKTLKPYMNEKGNLAFPLDEKIPIKLIGDVAVALWKQSQKVSVT